MRGTVARFLLLAVVVGMTACSDDPEPGFEVEGSGSVEGLVFFDADKNGVFDPSAGDTPLPNVGISVLARGTQETLANGTGQSDASGRFVLSGIAPGSHSLVVDTATANGVKFCLNPLPVTVLEPVFRLPTSRISWVEKGTTSAVKPGTSRTVSLCFFGS